jgi:hypothetical protein
VPIRREHQKTFPKTRLPETLLMFIRLRGGANAAIDPAFAYGPLADYFQLSPEDRALSRDAYYTNDPKPGRAWDNEVQWAARELKNDGYVVRTVRAGQSIWRLTSSGVDRADFWLVRMTEKTAALKALAVDAQLASVQVDDQSQALASA